mmetsp:Transcript_14744/g.40732  ORF Transcript_14744/g.40732 Transcript_14744/m.40732 type:complete len:511 (-) Transcript_14744:102-1634(-)
MLSESMSTVPSFERIPDDNESPNGNSMTGASENIVDGAPGGDVDPLLNGSDAVEDDDWGVVVTNVDSNDLESTGILIVPPAEHDEMISMASRSISTGKASKEATTSTLGGQVVPAQDEVSLRVEEDDIESEVSLEPTPSTEENKPADQVTMEIPVKDEPSKLSSHEEHSLDGDDTLRDQAHADRKLSERLRMADEISSLMMKTNVAAADTKINSWHNLSLLVTAVGLFSMVVMGGMSMLESQRQKFEASNSLLEERIQQLQVELLTKMEQEKAEDMQRQAEFAVLKEEFKQALQEREKISLQAQEQMPAQEPGVVPDVVPVAQEPARERFNASYKKLKFSFGSFSSSSHIKNDSQYHFDNCWVQAEAKLGECAQETRNAFRSKLQTLGRSLWHVQEHLVDKVNGIGGKVNDFGRKIQTVAKETAERVVVEMTTADWSVGHKQNLSYSSPLHPRHYEQHASQTAYSVNTTKSTNFRSLATSLVSSVAFASLATVVADKAATYISGLADERD